MRVADRWIETIEGNTSDSVQRRTYAFADSRIAGYGRPNWKIVETGIVPDVPETPEEPETNPDKDTAIDQLAKEFPKVDGAFAMLPMVGEMTKTILSYTDEEAQKYIDDNTQGKTAKVYGSLINGEKDVIFVSEPSDDILRQAEEAGVEFEMVGIGYDGFVFLVNNENPVDNLTLDQIRSIYAGDITNWRELGGENFDIYPYQREENSGSQNLMEKMVMQGTKFAPTKSGRVVSSMEGLVDAISEGNTSRYSLGYSIYLYAKEQYVKDYVKFLKINGVEANDENIANKSYPLTKVVYAVMRSDEPEGSPARRLVDWLLTDAGQEVVKAGGYVSLYS